jgi:hypothetical protein
MSSNAAIQAIEKEIANVEVQLTTLKFGLVKERAKAEASDVMMHFWYGQEVPQQEFLAWRAARIAWFASVVANKITVADLISGYL